MPFVQDGGEVYQATAFTVGMFPFSTLFYPFLSRIIRLNSGPRERGLLIVRIAMRMIPSLSNSPLQSHVALF